MIPHPITHWYDTTIVQDGRSGAFWLLLSLVVGSLLVLAAGPLRLSDNNDGSRLVLSIAIVVRMVTSSVAFLKSKWTLGVLGLVFPLVGPVAAIRPARPASVWARRLYVHRPEKMAAAERRNVNDDKGLNRLRNFPAGAPTVPPQ